jgi:hypothetical protein
MKRVFNAILLLCLFALTAGCSGRFEVFAFQTAEGARIDIWQSPRVSTDRQALFQPGADRKVSPVYHLAHPLAVESSGQSFGLSYTSDIPHSTLTLLSDKKSALASATLPATAGNPVRYLVPLQRGSRIWGYQLSSEAAQGTLTLLGAGTAPTVHGFLIDDAGLSVDGSVEVLSASSDAVSTRLTESTRKEMDQGTWLLSLETGRPGGRAVFNDAGGKTASFEMASTAAARLDFARGSMPFLPRDITFTGSLRSLRISHVPADAPLPADPGAILTWDRSAWRMPDYELFSWTRFPQVLILDFATYDVQDAFFKRIAFFVEKAGHAGRIESPAALASLHGYNAHDYRAEDLARFFADAGGSLSIEENTLSRILLDNGVIRKSASGFTPGEGCILSISRSSSPLLRSLLLTHESFHGIYFSLPAFRDATEKEWDSLSQEEQDVWVEYLAHNNYDTTDHYLVVNEFQSYLMQQARAGVAGFQDITLSRMQSWSPHAAALARRLKATHPVSFLTAFNALDGALQEAGGPPGGQSFGIMESAP